MNQNKAARPTILGAAYLLLHLTSEWLFPTAAGTLGDCAWLPAGFALSLLLVGGLWFAPLVFVATGASSLFLLSPGLGWFRYAWPLILTLSLSLGAYSIKHWLGEKALITRLRELGLFLLICFLTCLFIGLAGAWSIKAAVADHPFSASLLLRTLSWAPLLGVLVTTPFFLELNRLFVGEEKGPAPQAGDQPTWVESLGQVVLLFACLTAASDYGQTGWVHLVGLFPLLWISLRHGLLGAGFASFVLVVGIRLVLRGEALNTLTLRVMFFHEFVVVALALGVGTLGTAHRRLLLSLRARQALLDGVLKGSQLGLWTWSPSGLMSFNPEWLQMFGYSAEEFGTQESAWRKLIHPEDLSHVLWLRDANWKGHQSLYEAEYRVLCKDGSHKWVLDRGGVVSRDRDGKPLSMAGTCFDLSVRKRVELELQRLVHVMDSASDYIGAADLQGNIFYANHPLLRLRNDTSLETAQRRHISEYYPEGVAQKLLRDGLPAAVTHGVYWSETELADTAGRTIPVSQNVVVHRDGVGEAYAFSFIARDISRPKQTEQAVHLAIRQEFQAQKYESLGALAGGIAHDFNNLLTAIVGNASLARLDVSGDSPTQNYFRQIEVAALRAAELCKSLHLYAGKGQATLQSVSVNDLLRSMEPSLKTTGGSRVEVVLELGESLPAIAADRVRLEQSVMQLVLNAVESYNGRTGAVRLRTRVETADAELLHSPFQSTEFRPGPHLVLEVIDDGMGMSPTTRSRLFEPFFSTKQGQHGIGLAVVLGVARSHGGAVQVLSEQGKGSAFRLYLPMGQVITQIPDPISSTITDWRSAGQVLVIDDEETVRTVSTYMLESIGFTPLVAKDGAEGIKIFRQHGDSLRAVLLDLTMAHLDGEQVFSEIRRMDADTPVVIMSGFNEKEVMTRFKEQDPAGFLHKPFTIAELRAVMHKALS